MLYRTCAVAFLFSLTPLLSQAQQQAETNPAEVVDQRSIAQELGFPVRIVESDQTQRNEVEALEREKQALLAQQSMDSTAKSARNAAWISTLLVAVGTALLFWTLYLTRRANAAAQDAVSVTREVARDETRAYVHMANVSFKVVQSTDGTKRAIFTFHVTNSGSTPCPRFEIRGVARLHRPGSGSASFPEMSIDRKGWNALPAGTTYDGPIPVHFIDDEKNVIERDPMTEVVILSGEIRYMTIYSEWFLSEFEFMSKDQATGRGKSHDNKKMSRTPRDCKVFKALTDEAAQDRASSRTSERK